MKKALKVLNQLEKEGLIKRYAIGGAIAGLFYGEPVLTYDVDVFTFLPTGKENLTVLSPLYDYLRKKGYREDKKHVIIDGVPVQFLPAFNALLEEAVNEAKEVKYKEVKTRVLRVEHLAAVMLETGRPKDKTKLILLLEQAKINQKKFAGILRRHGLTERWNRFKHSVL